MIDTKASNTPFVSTKYSDEYVKLAHKATFANESMVMASEKCMCLYCGHTFNAREQSEPLIWIQERAPNERTLRCSMSGIDCVLPSASGFPIDDPEFIRICTETWFSGISRISDGLPVERLSYVDLFVE